MKNTNTDDDFYENESFDDDVTYYKRPKASRSKEKYEARRKIEAYLERKTIKQQFDDYDYPEWSADEFMDDYVEESDVNLYMNDYAEDQDWIDYSQRVDNQDFRF